MNFTVLVIFSFDVILISGIQTTDNFKLPNISKMEEIVRSMFEEEFDTWHLIDSIVSKSVEKPARWQIRVGNWETY